MEGGGTTTSSNTSSSGNSGSNWWVFNPADIISTVQGWLSGPLTSLAGCITAIANGIKDFSDAVGAVLATIIQKIADVIGVVTLILQALTVTIIGKITDFLSNFNDFVSALTAMLVAIPLEIAEQMKVMFLALFVPVDNPLQANFVFMQNEFNDKFPIVPQVETLMGSLFTDISPKKPNFVINIPQWGIKDAKIIDFDIIDDYLPYIRGITLGLFWVYTLIKIFKMLPSVIGGLTSYNDQPWQEAQTQFYRDKWSG